LYIASVNRTLDNYRALLAEVKKKDFHLPNTDFDTGQMTHAAEYKLSDEAYAHLLDDLSRDNFQQLTPALRQNILGFYKDDNAPIATKKKAAAWERTQQELQKLRSAAPQEMPSIQMTGLP
jgi:hypothetical protein